MDLKWTIPEYKERQIPRLGKLLISMNFLMVIGQRTKDCGLAEAWAEAGFLGSSTIVVVMTGKAYNKGMRRHKLSSVQALWRLLLPELLTFLNFLQTKDANLTDIEKLSEADGIDKLTTTLKTTRYVVFMTPHTCPIPMQDVRCKNQKGIGHSICQMDQMDLLFSIGLLRVHWIQWTNGMSIGQQWINRNYASTE
jgi:hypothetical protein